MLDFCVDVSVANGHAVPVLVAHNAQFDNDMLLNGCWQSGFDVPSEWRTLCSRWTAHAAVKAEEPSGSPWSYNLSDLAKRFGCARSTAPTAPAVVDILVVKTLKRSPNGGGVATRV